MFVGCPHDKFWPINPKCIRLFWDWRFVPGVIGIAYEVGMVCSRAVAGIENAPPMNFYPPSRFLPGNPPLFWTCRWDRPECHGKLCWTHDRKPPFLHMIGSGGGSLRGFCFSRLASSKLFGFPYLFPFVGFSCVAFSFYLMAGNEDGRFFLCSGIANVSSTLAVSALPVLRPWSAPKCAVYPFPLQPLCPGVVGRVRPVRSGLEYLYVAACVAG